MLLKASEYQALEFTCYRATLCGGGAGGGVEAEKEWGGMAGQERGRGGGGGLGRWDYRKGWRVRAELEAEARVELEGGVGGRTYKCFGRAELVKGWGMGAGRGLKGGGVEGKVEGGIL